ncbi:MAG: MFS transporter [Thermoleophilia bacterium]|nr:MFS transporter [Thermoleophilia bacterium]
MPTAPPARADPALARAIRRNTFLLSASLAVNSATLQLAAAVASLTFVEVTGVAALLGLGPAIFLASSGLTALPAGRAMDRFGRVPVLATGYAVGALGGGVTGIGAHAVATPAVIAGFVLMGAAGGVALLARTAAGDMYPPERRGRGIGLVLVGAVFGAILGPAVFGPLFAGRELEPEALSLPWFVAGGFMLVGAVLVLLVRPDPKTIGQALAAGRAEPVAPPAAPLREILARPGVVPALVAALASFSVMAALMNLVSYVVVHEHGHHQADVFPIIGAHVFGMYALVLVVGTLIDRVGRRQALVAGLLVMALAAASLATTESVGVVALLLFALGIGWNFSFVAATAALADRATVAERGRLLGLNDLGSALLAAVLVLLGGLVVEALSPVALALAATALVFLPAVWIARPAARVADKPQTTSA